MSILKFEVSIPGSTLTVYDDCVSFKHKGAFGFLTKGIQGERKLYYNQISSLQFRESNKLTSGFIEFYLIGHNSKQGGGLISGTNNENRFTFYHRDLKKMIEVYEFVQDRINSTQTTASKELSDVDKLVNDVLKLKELLDSGILTQEEFDIKKKQLMNL